MLPWPPRVHLAIFVHRVTGLTPGLYLLARDPAQTDALRAALKPEFAWETMPGCPSELALFRLASGDTRGIAQRISCGQDIAADGCFSLGMIAEFEGPLTAARRVDVPAAVLGVRHDRPGALPGG